jgi:hypothetical protein
MALRAEVENRFELIVVNPLNIKPDFVFKSTYFYLVRQKRRARDD